MLRSLKFVSVLTVVAIFAVALPAAAAPTLTSISPTSGYPGTQVTLNGTNFGATQGTGSVWLGNKLAGSIVSWSNTQIVAVVAASAASGSAQVQQGGVWSNSIAFTIITPNITSISPTSGYPGTQVTINGTNFGATQGSGSVWLGNKLAGSIVSWSSTQIVATVAATAASGSAQVQQNGVWGNSVTFTVITPSISSISPTSGYPGTQVTINGTNFGATQGSGSVWLGNKLAGSIVSWSNTQIVAVVAATATSGSAQVQQGGVWSNSITFTVITPSISSITPTSGVAGTQVTFAGTNFGASQGTGSVWLGSKLAGSIVSWSNTQIVATVDSGSITGSAQVQQGGVWSNSIAFTVATPTLSSISPTSARAGDQITLTGTNFGASQGSGSVWLGSKLAASIVSWSSTQIVATIASGSITGTAQVQQGGVWTNSIGLEVVTPHVVILTPQSGPVGRHVLFNGTGFGATQGSGKVWLGNKYANVVSWSDDYVLATVADGSATGTAQLLQNGVWSNSFPFTVEPAVTINIFNVSNLLVGGFDQGGGTVQLNGPAPAGGAVVSLSSSNAAISIQSSVTIPEGDYVAFFDIVNTQEVASPLDATITASYNGTDLTSPIRLIPPGVRNFYFDSSELITGQTVTGTIELYKPAPTGGAAVSIVSGNAAFVVPSTVTVPEGETQTTFDVTVSGTVPERTYFPVTANYNNEANPEFDLQLAPPTVSSVSVSPSTVEGGEEVTIDLTLSATAAAGTIVRFTSTHSSLRPGPFTFPTGQTTAQFTFRTNYVASAHSVVLTAFIEEPGATASATINPLSITLDSVSLSPSEVVGSNAATLTVNLTAAAAAGGLEVDLYGSGNGVSLPPFVTVPAGQTSVTVPVQTSVVAETLNTNVGAHHAVTDRSAALQVDVPPANFVSSLTLATSRTGGGNLVTATVTLNAAAGTGGAVVSLDSDNLAVATVPSSVTVAQGNTTATFDIDTDAVTGPVDVTIRAAYSGANRTARLTVVANEGNVSIDSLTLSPEIIPYGGDVTGTVTLSGAAPAGGIVVTLGGSRAGLATVPASVTVPEGETSATFTITTDAPSYPRYVLVTATYDGLVRPAMLTVIQGVE